MVGVDIRRGECDDAVHVRDFHDVEELIDEVAQRHNSGEEFRAQSLRDCRGAQLADAHFRRLLHQPQVAACRAQDACAWMFLERVLAYR